MINKVEKDGVLILDDYTTEKYGHNIYGTDYHYDHSKKRNIFGLQIADCVLSGNGIFPLLSSIYIRKNSRWNSGNKHKTKIELQKRHLTMLNDMGMKFKCVVFDSWYNCIDFTDHIESLGKDWIGEVKSNRQIRVGNEWISVQEFAERAYSDRIFQALNVGDRTYLVKAYTVEMKRCGIVKLVISLNEHNNFKFFTSNRIEWNVAKILKRYCRRWDIEVWHREGKVDYGLKDCQLRNDGGVSKYLTLSSCADTFLEIVTLLSPLLGELRRKVSTPGLKRRFVHYDLLKSFISYIQTSGGRCYEKILTSLLYPYKSTKVKRLTVI
jgi:hypothetical protein